MDLEYRSVLAPSGLPSHAHLITPSATPSDLRNNPRFPRPISTYDLSARSSEPCEMEKIPPITGKRRGGSRKACNECKQQKVSLSLRPAPPSTLISAVELPRPSVPSYLCPFPSP
jgi:hypothetical protein